MRGTMGRMLQNDTFGQLYVEVWNREELAI